MLPAAMAAMTDPCLPESWHDYEAFAGLFAMAAALAMQLIEFIAHQRYRSAKTSALSPNRDRLPHVSHSNDEVQITIHPVEVCESSGHQHGVAFQDDAQRHKVSTYLLEFGIALHSILIGVTLGVTTDSFVALLIALSFHQFFEGMALGAQIARVERMSLMSAIFMVLFFAITTPIGIAIGIGIHSRAYNPKSVAALLVNGILDSVSAGILIYMALVNLITAEMGVGASTFHALKTRLKVLYFVALYLGAGAMALIGRWA
jgi:solute carrier family 39 (zinc transporter), member 1/2/3